MRSWEVLGRIGGYVLYVPIWIVARFTTRTRVLVVHKDEILVVQGWLGTGSWLAPGGGIQQGESPEAAACRELLEETGLRVPVEHLTSLGKMRQTKGYVYPFHGFLLELRDKPETQVPRREINAARWIHRKDIATIRVHQHISLLLSAWQQKR